MTLPTTEHQALRTQLDSLAERGAAVERRVATRQELQHAFVQSLPWVLVVPGVCLFIQLVQWVEGDLRWDLPLGYLIAATLGLPLLVVVGRVAWRFVQPVDRRVALGIFDRELDLSDRLVTADEFLRLPARSGFHAAAVEDAARVASAALTATPGATPRPVAIPRRAWLAPLGSLLIGALVLWLGQDEARRSRGTGSTPVAVRTAPTQPPETPDEDEQTPRTYEPRTASPQPVAQSPQRAGDVQASSLQLSQDAKKNEGATQAGQSSEAESASGESDSRGAPSNQGQPLKSDPKKRAPKESKPSPKKPTAPPPDATKKPSTGESGSTAGRGSSKGSNKNPVASDWASKDQVTAADDDEIDDDEDVEDETSDSEARGGIQPSLRDRKPPVSRDLTIGFGNQPNPDANGRGGPSQQKKSRGTASLVLGVPIPDRVKGQPNPGKTKVTQERVEPRRQEAAPRDAEARTPRQSPIGPLEAPTLSPWMRELVRTYFLNLRLRAKGQP